MASTDALALPLKNTAYRVKFSVKFNTQLFCTGWTGATAKISKDDATYVAATNTPTEVLDVGGGAGSGTGYLDLTAAEMNTNNTQIIITVTNTGALPVNINLYPATDAMIRVNVVDWLSQALAAVNINGVPVVDLKYILGSVLTETAGQIAAGFKKLLNVATPIFTLASANQSGDVYASLVSDSGTAQSGSTTNIRLKAGAPAVGLIGQTVFVVSGTGAGQSSSISAYNTSTKDATTVWGTAPANDSVYVVLTIQGGSGGSSSDPLLNTVPGSYGAGTAGEALGKITGIKTKTDLITVGSIAVQSPVAANGDTTVYTSRDYSSTDSLALHYTMPYTVLNTDTFNWNINTATVTTGVYVDATHVDVAPTSAQLATLRPGDYDLEIEVIRSGRKLEPIKGKAHILAVVVA